MTSSCHPSRNKAHRHMLPENVTRDVTRLRYASRRLPYSGRNSSHAPEGAPQKNLAISISIVKGRSAQE